MMGTVTGMGTSKSRAAKRAVNWQYLTRRPGSVSKQLFIKDTRILGSSVWASVNSKAESEEEIAASYRISVSALREAVRYCEENRNLIEQDNAKSIELLRQMQANAEA